MTARTYDELFDTGTRPTLTLEQSLTGKFTAVDQTGRIYFYPSTPNMDVVVRFMRALALRGDVDLDESSITWFRALGGQHSVKIGREPEGAGGFGQHRAAEVVSRAATGEPASLPASVAGDGAGTDGVSPSRHGAEAAISSEASPPRLHLVRGDAA